MCIVLISLMHGRFADLYGGISAMPQVIAQPLSNHDCGQENAHLAAITKPTHRENPKNDTSCHPQPEHHPVLILQQQSLLCCRSLRLQTKQTVSGITPILLIRRFSHAYPACGCSRKNTLIHKRCRNVITRPLIFLVHLFRQAQRHRSSPANKIKPLFADSTT